MPSRMRSVRAAMDGLKESKQAVGAEVLASVQNFAPPTILAQASRLNFSTRLFNLLVTNVPGPQFPLYLRGRQLLDVFPIAFLPKDHALAIAIMSYNGQMSFGLLGDYDAMPDIDDFGTLLEESLAEMERYRPHDLLLVVGALVGEGPELERERVDVVVLVTVLDVEQPLDALAVRAHRDDDGATWLIFAGPAFKAGHVDEERRNSSIR